MKGKGIHKTKNTKEEYIIVSPFVIGKYIRLPPTLCLPNGYFPLNPHAVARIKIEAKRSLEDSLHKEVHHFFSKTTMVWCRYYVDAMWFQTWRQWDYAQFWEGLRIFFWSDHGDLERHKLMVAHGEQLLSKLRNEKKMWGWCGHGRDLTRLQSTWWWKRARFQEADDNRGESNVLAMKKRSWTTNLEKPPRSEDRRGRAVGLRSNLNLESDES